MDECRTAWEVRTDSGWAWTRETWSLEQLSEQFQKVIDLCGLVEEDNVGHDDGNTSPCNPGPNDHNCDVNSPEINDDEDDEDCVPRKISEPYKNKYTARILLIEMKAALSRQFDGLSDDEQKKVSICLVS